MLSLIVAKADNGVIGKDNQMPWHIPQDLQFFKAKTMGKPIIMGRKTFDSLGRVLPGRPHIIISRNATLTVPENCYLVGSLQEAIAQAQEIAQARNITSETLSSGQADEAVIIGGAQIYAEALALVDRLYVTEVQLEPEGDAFFPEIDTQVWQAVERTKGEGDIPHCFVTYDKCQ
ncbi:MAG: dihydrofolate reductase [Moraxellaceae bacterium]|nr:MAG: dihydrofolate reductase [Moraxellaceae bacterium]